MQRPVCALLLAITAGGVVSAACGSLEDERPLCTKDSDESECGRPLTVEYLTLAILAPSCGQTQCHSKFRQAGGLVFDNPHDARKSMLTPGSGPLLQFTSEQFDPLDSGRSNLIQWLLPLNSVNKDTGRMPFDAALPSIDIQLLQVWIRQAPEDETETPIESGASARGAQCDPDLYDGLACNGDDLVRCNDDFNFGEPVMTCTTECRITEPCIEYEPDPMDPANFVCVNTGPTTAECKP